MTEIELGEWTAEEPRDVAGVDEDDDDDDGPPPGFNCIARSTAADSEEKIENEVQKVEEEEDEEEEGEIGDEEDMDGPPPGWSPIPPNLESPDVEMSEKQEVLEDERDVPPPGSKIVSPISQAADDLPTDKEVRNHKKGVQSGPITPPPSLLPPHMRPQPLAAASSPSDKGQMVCGGCLQLLAYPRGVKYVKCSCCQTVNLVLEANQVGQVTCGGCAALLMYPHGAPSVKCCSCRFVTDIGAHNRQPPLSSQQARRRSSLNLVH